MVSSRHDSTASSRGSACGPAHRGLRGGLARRRRSQPAHGIARHGPPALPPGFPHLPYANPDAPKGGRLVVGQLGTFDSMNPYIARGAVPEVSPGSGVNTLIVQPLMMRSLDEPFTLYGLVAETIETDASRSWVEFRLNPRAAFADGRPVTAEDVRFTFELLREKGRPAQRNAYRRVKDIAIADERTIRFTFQDSDGELPMLLALMPALARHDINRETFDQPTFARRWAAAPTCSPSSIPERASRSGATRISGGRTCLSCGATTTSMRSGSISIATATPCSRVSKSASTTCVSRPTPPNGNRDTTSRPCATGASFGNPSASRRRAA